ncbi:hypothetical protein DES53_104280 [Roseimicrobium gellanilyticum]|uniref:Uncharacterized protein n=1 Tax=Roseimicrobium gellanilyticum TaxID=748857 RepID=A0A366HMS8_9BACT|nr:hypothetical protein [Roseimicrobium gellanilyticum]RBP44459.1 hypothetical protein DES53_104280 [Roseimicrobium gellanilyticum]
MPEEQDTNAPEMPSSLGLDGQSPGKMKVRDVLAQSGELSSMFGQGQGQGQGQGNDAFKTASQGLGDMANGPEGAGQGAAKFTNMMGSGIQDITGGDEGGGDTDIGQQLEGMGQQMAEVGQEIADVAIEVGKQVIETGVKAATMVAGAAVGMPGVGGGGMSMGGGGGGIGMGGGGGGGLGGLADLGGQSGGEPDAGIADVIRTVSGKDDKEHKLTVRQATGLSLPQQGMGIDGPKQGIKMR